MQTLRIKVELNRGREGIPIGKFAEISQDMGLFLSKFSTDLGLNDEKWIATRFSNGSVMFDCQKEAMSDESFSRGQNGLRSIFSNDNNAAIGNRIRPSTRLQFARIGKRIDADEVIYIGLYRNGENDPQERFSLTRGLAAKIIEENERLAKYHGEIQGTVHSFYKEAKPPYLYIRELSSNALIKCFFKPRLYQAAIVTMEEPNAVIFVEGEVTENMGEETIESVEASGFRLAPEFDLSFFESCLGKFPNATGDLTSEKFIENLRSDD